MMKARWDVRMLKPASEAAFMGFLYFLIYLYFFFKGFTVFPGPKDAAKPIPQESPAPPERRISEASEVQPAVFFGDEGFRWWF